MHVRFAVFIATSVDGFIAKCAFQFQRCVILANGGSWQLQEEWSNAVSGCVQQ